MRSEDTDSDHFLARLKISSKRREQEQLIHSKKPWIVWYNRMVLGFLKSLTVCGLLTLFRSLLCSGAWPILGESAWTKLLPQLSYAAVGIGPGNI